MSSLAAASAVVDFSFTDAAGIEKTPPRRQVLEGSPGQAYSPTVSSASPYRLVSPVQPSGTGRLTPSTASRAKPGSLLGTSGGPPPSGPLSSGPCPGAVRDGAGRAESALPPPPLPRATTPPTTAPATTTAAMTAIAIRPPRGLRGAAGNAPGWPGYCGWPGAPAPNAGAGGGAVRVYSVHSVPSHQRSRAGPLPVCPGSGYQPGGVVMVTASP